MEFKKFLNERGRKVVLFNCLIIILFILFLAAVTWMTNDMRNRDAVKEVYKFNRQVPIALQQESMEDIESRCEGLYVGIDDWAYLWNFGEKYEIKEFPPLEAKDLYDRLPKSKNFIQKLKDVDEYVQKNQISREKVSNVLNQAFALQSTDLIYFLELSK